jgi:hypothetical protein
LNSLNFETTIYTALGEHRLPILLDPLPSSSLESGDSLPLLREAGAEFAGQAERKPVAEKAGVHFAGPSLAIERREQHR